MMIGMMLCETGSRMYHGNLAWQIFICNYIWFFVTLYEWLKQIQKNKFYQVKDFVLLFVFICHVLSGLNYIFNYLLNEISF
jgi:hypothetical protein